MRGNTAEHRVRAWGKILGELGEELSNGLRLFEEDTASRLLVADKNGRDLELCSFFDQSTSDGRAKSVSAAVPRRFARRSRCRWFFLNKGGWLRQFGRRRGSGRSLGDKSLS